MQVPVIGIIPLGDNLMVITARAACSALCIKSQRIVEILGDPAPFASLGPWSPHHIIISRIVEIVEIEVHRRNPDILLPVHEFSILIQGMAMLVEERGKGVVVVFRALLQFTVFDQVDILQSIVVGQDIVLVGTLSDVQQTPVVAIDIDNGWTPGLPIDVGMLSHCPLTDGISHISVVAIIA